MQTKATVYENEIEIEIGGDKGSYCIPGPLAKLFVGDRYAPLSNRADIYVMEGEPFSLYGTGDLRSLFELINPRDIRLN